MTAYLTSRKVTATVATCLAATLIPVVVTPASAASACAAKMSVPNPRQHTITKVLVSKVRSGSTVRTTAAYKSTKTVKQAKANTSGVASTTYNISRATKGYKVVVTVRATSGASVWTCSTSFIPR